MNGNLDQEYWRRRDDHGGRKVGDDQDWDRDRECESARKKLGTVLKSLLTGCRLREGDP